MTLGTSAVILIVTFLVTMFLGVPVSWSLIIASLAGALVKGGIPIAVIAQRMFSAGESYPMLAIPAFFLAGDIMCMGGISKRLTDFVDAILGWLSGALSIVSITACTFFAAISGSATATTSAIGSIMIPEMVKKGYPPSHAAACQSIGGTLGPVIPPSIIFIFYANATSLSISQLLVSGIIPGLFSCFLLCVTAYIVAKIYKFPKGNKFVLKRALKAFKDAAFAILMPFIVLGGIYTGTFTPTEAAGVSVIYGIIVSMLIYRTITLRQLFDIVKKTAITTANLEILVTAAVLFGWFVSYFNIAKLVAAWIIAVSSTVVIFWLLTIVVLVVAGMFIDGLATVVILAPILNTVAIKYGIDPIHYGLVVTFLLCLGNATPPFGTTLYISSGIAKAPILKTAKSTMPFIFAQIVCALLFSFIPWFSTFLPKLMY